MGICCVVSQNFLQQFQKFYILIMALPINYTKEETSTEGKDNSENSSSNTTVENNKKSRQTNSARVIYHRGMSTNSYSGDYNSGYNGGYDYSYGLSFSTNDLTKY